MTRGNRLTNEELEEIRERLGKATEGNPLLDVNTLAYMNAIVIEDIPELLAEIERLNDRLRDVEILYNECSTELDSYYK